MDLCQEAQEAREARAKHQTSGRLGLENLMEHGYKTPLSDTHRRHIAQHRRLTPSLVH